ncbi:REPRODUCTIVE MERISTEM 39, REDUCED VERNALIZATION RESPONSE 1 [Hibiscus trionum]|uniref:REPRODUCTIVE MERISTEM 39, REDUCED VERNALIZATION RESPONSE 1 n=1 Tax=Hibiscus trionum TaxID=183268 RepID=A0A9W7J4P6_HIBTR|nr:REPRODUCTIVE MERISTEM 39, REDUCED VERNALIZATION RESPONSE 1 [Hibiscus trionum]
MENNNSMFTPKTPHFFKIILESTIRNKKLGIPKKFEKKYGNKLSNSVLLSVPSGDTWRVELTKSDGVVWLQNGWQDFFVFYSLQKGHLLLFKYEGNDKFQVVIFDMSTSEIEYPCKSHIRDHTSGEQVCRQLVKEEAKDDIGDEIVHEIPPTKEITKKKPQASCSKPRKKQKISKKVKNEDDCEDLPNGEEDLQTEVPGYANALLRARAFKSENPFFLVTMQPSYIEPGRKICIPKDFSLKFLKEKTDDLTLCNSGGKTWPARYWRYITSHKYTKTTIHIGWEPFMQENNLKAGDVCVFELISQTEIKLKVLIYRQDTSGSFPLESKQNLKAIALQRAGNFKSIHPFFKVVMQPIYLYRNSLNVPYKFVREHLDEEKTKAVLQVADGRTWNVKFTVNVLTGGQRKAEFYPWRTFAWDNNLGRGDVCVFELINRHENAFKVSIF